MSNELSNNHLSLFENIKQTDENGNEFWMARQLAKVLQYSDFRNFTSVVEKAKEACINSGQLVEDHLVELNEVVAVGSGGYKYKLGVFMQIGKREANFHYFINGVEI